ncbi:hypothetical protein NUSPORA_01553 [Nucleospora cyclopteri]
MKEQNTNLDLVKSSNKVLKEIENVEKSFDKQEQTKLKGNTVECINREKENQQNDENEEKQARNPEEIVLIENKNIEFKQIENLKHLQNKMKEAEKSDAIESIEEGFKRVKRNASIKAAQKIQKQKENDRERFKILNREKFKKIESKRRETRFASQEANEICKTRKESDEEKSGSRFCGIKIKKMNNRKLQDKTNNTLIFEVEETNKLSENNLIAPENEQTLFFCDNNIWFSDEESDLHDYKYAVKQNTRRNKGYKTVTTRIKAVLAPEDEEIEEVFIASRKRIVTFSDVTNQVPHNENEVKGILKQPNKTEEFYWEGEKEEIEIIKKLNLTTEFPIVDFEFCKVADETINDE